MVKSKEKNCDTRNDNKKQKIIEYLWLTYYNDTLYERGVITEDERNKMRTKIKTRTLIN